MSTELEVMPQKSLLNTSDQNAVQQYKPEQGPLSVAQVSAGLKAIHEVMRDCMTEGQDYGKVPGCGDKPGLFQPGAQKLSMMFQLNPAVQAEVVTDYPNFHRGYRLVVRVVSGGKFAEGVGECSTMESKYRYRNAGKKCPECGKETIIKGKEQYGGGWLCFEKKGGCGWKCNDGTPAAAALQSQDSGKVEHDNPADFWNTVRKMAFKRAFVHAIINATNTSELWSQDLEDLAANGVVGQDRAGQDTLAQEAPKKRQQSLPATSSRPKPENAPAGTQAPANNVLEADMELEDWTEKPTVPKDKTKKGYTVWEAKFRTAAGTVFIARTITRELGEQLAGKENKLCTITYKPGRFEGTYELLSIKEA
jgi:hypothetical protein